MPQAFPPQNEANIGRIEENTVDTQPSVSNPSYSDYNDRGEEEERRKWKRSGNTVCFSARNLHICLESSK